jgi:hypothetical protein
VLYDPLLRKLTILDRKAPQGAKPLLLLEQVAAAAATELRGASWVFATGTSVQRLDPHTLRTTELATLAEEPRILVASGALALAATERGLSWLAGHGGVRASLPFSEPSAIAIDHAGVAWAANDESLVRWDGARLLPVEPLPEPISGLVPNPTVGMVARGRSGKVYVLDLQGHKVRELEVPRSAALSHLEPLAVWMDLPRLQLHLLDLIGGEAISVPLSSRAAATFLFDTDGRILTINLLQRQALELPALPPTQPAALRAWLDTATNAEPTLTRSELRWSLPPLLEGPSAKP